MANPHQIKKTVQSTSTRKAPSVLCFKLRNIEDQGELLREHLGKLAASVRAEGMDKRLTALILGRYHFNRPSEMPLLRDEISDAIDLGFSTVHAAKGLEADYIFLLNVVGKADRRHVSAGCYFGCSGEVLPADHRACAMASPEPAPGS